MLKEQQWNTQFDNQLKRIAAVIEIAHKEHESVYNDISSLIDDQEQFSLDNLLNYSISQWLFKRNPVIVKFIETLTSNADGKLGEKLFKCDIQQIYYIH